MKMKKTNIVNIITIKTISMYINRKKVMTMAVTVGHGHHGHHNHGDMVEDFKKRFFISLIVTIPILVFLPMIQGFMGVD